jgi:hypothetical protein
VEELFLPFCLLILIGILLNGIRNIYGSDGSDHMNIVIYVSAVIYGLSAESILSQNLSLWFISIQYILSLFIAGIYKLSSEIWRSGKALPGIMSMKHYGNHKIYDTLKSHKNISILLSWYIILIQCIFWTIFFVPLNMIFIFIALGFIFHISIAITMGLNNFLFSFLACYPVLWICIQNSQNFISNLF